MTRILFTRCHNQFLNAREELKKDEPLQTFWMSFLQAVTKYLRLFNESLVKHQKVSKYYAIACLENFILLFMSLLRVKFAKRSHI